MTLIVEMINHHRNTNTNNDPGAMHRRTSVCLRSRAKKYF